MAGIDYVEPVSVETKRVARDGGRGPAGSSCVMVADHVARLLEERGVEHVFEVSGGYIAHLLDSIHRRGKPGIVSCHHEQSAAFAADAVGRLTGVPGVAIATAGPGATNLLTGVASCYFDSSPAVFLTGNVHTRDRRGNRPVRQLGFQETDIVSMARPVTKAAWAASRPEEVPELLERAFELATGGRPGPVLVDIPLDAQYAEIEEPDRASPPAAPARVGPLQDVIERLKAAKRPLIWVGGGVRAARATERLRDFVREVGVPVVSSLLGLDALPWSDPLRVGFIGAYGNRWANLAAGESDFILVLGARLDARQTGSETAEFKGDRTIVHVDCEAGEINNRVPGCQGVEADVGAFLSSALELARGRSFEERTAWLERIEELRRRHPDTTEPRVSAGINPNALMHRLSQASTAAAAYTLDVGQHQMWAAQSLELAPQQRVLTSGGLGSMGFALPAAIGAAVVEAPRPILVVAGDGGFQCNLQELQTVARNRLALKIVVIDNGCHGMTRQFQEKHFGERYQSSLWGYSAPNFSRVAAAYGIESRSLEEEADTDEALAWLWRDPASPALLRVKVDAFTNLYPKLAFGRPITEMEPQAEPRSDWTPRTGSPTVGEPPQHTGQPGPGTP